jgi:cytochrome c oxidase subunit 1
MNEAERKGFIRHGASNWKDYLTFNTDHKVIGVQYLVTTFIFFLVGGLFAMLIRFELLDAANTFGPDSYNTLFTMHGSAMIFLFVIPAMAGFGNYLIPLMIGADDMAFPRLNALSYWMLLAGGLVITAGNFAGQANTGWTAYAPLSLQAPLGQTLWSLGAIIIGTSSLFGSINFLTTISQMRAPGMTYGRLPLFCWAMIATSIMVLLATPVLTTALLLLVLERELGMVFFEISAGGDPLAWQNLFWFYSHPAVYIMIVPGMGLISEVLPVFSRKPIFGYKAIAASSIAIAVLGFLVWAHHMFTTGMSPALQITFMATSMVIAVPTGVKIFNWIGTIWGGVVDLKTPMLFSIGFIALFTVGGLSGITLAAVPVNIHVQDTYYVVGHLHYVLIGGAVMAIFGAMYFWFPKITGRMFDDRIGQLHFALTFLAFNLTFLPMHWLGLQGMPRRVASYAPEFESMNQLASLGSFLLGIAVLPFLYNMLVSWARGKQAGPNPWKALSLEWQTSSPPPAHNFDAPPQVSAGPYEFGAHPGEVGAD